MSEERSQFARRIDEHSFGLSRRGYNKDEVKSYLEDLEQAFRELEGHARRQGQKLAELEHSLSKARATEKVSVDNAMMAVFDCSDQSDPANWRRIASVGDPSWRGAYPNPFHMAFTPDESKMYVTLWWPPPTDNSIAVVDTKTWKIVKEHVIGPDTHTIAVTGDGKWLWLIGLEADRHFPGVLRAIGREELGEDLITRAFIETEKDLLIKDDFKENIKFIKQDIRKEIPDGMFHLILCRNLAFTYFEEDLQREILPKIIEKLHPKGFLVIGSHESLPQELLNRIPFQDFPSIFQFT